MTTIRVISFDGCPYVQRTMIVLRHKNIPHAVDAIDLSNKPAWFLELNPRGKVPVIVDDGHVIYESAVINEYLEERFPDPPMLAQDPRARAWERIWIEYANAYLMKHLAGAMFTKSAQRLAEHLDELSATIRQVDQELSTRTPGPYAHGSTLGLIDATYAPIFDRIESMIELWGWTAPSDTPHWDAWMRTVRADASVAATRLPDLITQYRPYRERQLAAFEGAHL